MKNGATASDSELFDSNPLTRLWSAWRRFWFSPADPTPLCFMRIVAGILTLYVHVAYSFDLVNFFGPHGWYDHTVANRQRREFPWVKTAANWDPKQQQRFV